MKKKVRSEIKMRTKEAMRQRRHLEGDLNIQRCERGKKIEEGYLKAIRDCERESSKSRKD